MVDRDPKRTSLQVETTKAIGNIESGSQEAILKDWFLRRLLMQIGYETVSGKVREGFSLLTPEETVLFYKEKVHPNAKLMEGLVAIDPGYLEGITTPHGLLVQGEKIMSVYYFTNDTSQKRIGHLFGMLELDRRTTKGVFDDYCSLNLVTLSDTPFNGLESRRVHQLKTNMDSETFDLLNQVMWNECKDDAPRLVAEQV